MYVELVEIKMFKEKKTPPARYIVSIVRGAFFFFFIEFTKPFECNNMFYPSNNIADSTDIQPSQQNWSVVR